MDRIGDMSVFVAIVDQGGLSAAARQLGLHRSVVSRRLSALEDRLGTRLVQRTTRRLALTETGTRYHERCQEILAAIESAEAEAGQHDLSPRGTVRVSVPVSYGATHVVPHLADFLKRYPDVKVDIDLNDRFVDIVGEGYDLAVRIGDLKDSTLIARRLAPVPTYIVASPDYLAAHGVPATPDELTNHECILYTITDTVGQWRYLVGAHPGSGGRWRAVRVSGRLRSNNGGVILQAALDGHGIARLPSFFVERPLAGGQLVRLLDGFAFGDGTAYALYPENRHVSAKVRAFVDFLVTRLSDR